MKWTIEYIRDGSFFRVVNEGIYVVGDSVKLYSNIFSDKSWLPGSSILFDNRLVDFRNVNFSVMKEASSRFALNHEQIGRSRIGYLVDSDFGFGISRQFQMLTESRASTIIEVFKDEKEAFDWILQNSLNPNKQPA